MGIKVKNAGGTAGRSCGCGSWLDHWTKHGGGIKPTYCVVDGCLEKELVGAHVVKDGRDHYIIPVCQKHNSTKDGFEVSWLTTFVPANVSLTCDRPKIRWV